MCKSVLATLGAITTMLVLACDQQPTEPTEVTVQPPAPNFAASHTKIVFQQPFSVDFTVPCKGEDVNVSGSEIIRIQQTISNSGNFIFSLHIKPSSLIGVGTTSGTMYRGARSPGHLVQKFHWNGVAQVLNILPQPIVLLGSGAKILIYDAFKLTVNANGDATVVRVNQSAKCI